MTDAAAGLYRRPFLCYTEILGNCAPNLIPEGVFCMTTCPFCHSPVPNQARFCPHCGSPIPAKRSVPLAKLLAVVAVFVLLAVATLLLSSYTSHRTYAENPRINPGNLPDMPVEPYYGSGRYSDLSMEVSFR